MPDQAVSFNPETFVSGGLLDDADVTFADAAIVMWDYMGKVPVPSPAIKLVMDTGDGDQVEQYYSLGSANDWMPTEDGKSIMAVGSATQLRASTNAAMFLESLVNNGFPAAKLGADISVLVGTEAHMIQKPQPKRGGDIPSTRKSGDKEYERTLLVVESIKKLPKGIKGTKAAGKKAATGKAAATADTGSDDGDDDAGESSPEAAAAAALVQLLADTPTIEKNKIPPKIFPIVKGTPDQAEILKIVFSDDFLIAGGEPQLGAPAWVYDGENVTSLG